MIRKKKYIVLPIICMLGLCGCGSKENYDISKETKVMAIQMNDDNETEKSHFASDKQVVISLGEISTIYTDLSDEETEPADINDKVSANDNYEECEKETMGYMKETTINCGEKETTSDIEETTVDCGDNEVDMYIVIRQPFVPRETFEYKVDSDVYNELVNMLEELDGEYLSNSKGMAFETVYVGFVSGDKEVKNIWFDPEFTFYGSSDNVDSQGYRDYYTIDEELSLKLKSFYESLGFTDGVEQIEKESITEN